MLKGVPQLRGRLQVISLGRCLCCFLNLFGRHLLCLVTRFRTSSLPDPHFEDVGNKNGVSINVCRLVTRTLFFMVIRCFFMVIRPESVAIGELK